MIKITLLIQLCIQNPLFLSPFSTLMVDYVLFSKLCFTQHRPHTGSSLSWIFFAFFILPKIPAKYELTCVFPSLPPQLPSCFPSVLGFLMACPYHSIPFQTETTWYWVFSCVCILPKIMFISNLTIWMLAKKLLNAILDLSLNGLICICVRLQALGGTDLLYSWCAYCWAHCHTPQIANNEQWPWTLFSSAFHLIAIYLCTKQVSKRWH